MQIYKMLFKTKEEYFLKLYDNLDVSWALSPDKNALITSSEEECNSYGILYAIEYETEDMTSKDLLNIMYQYLSIREVKQICSSDKTIEEMFMHFISNKPVDNAATIH